MGLQPLCNLLGLKSFFCFFRFSGEPLEAKQEEDIASIIRLDEKGRSTLTTQGKQNFS